MDESTTPLEAGLAWVVKIGKGEFIGRARLAQQADAGVSRRLVGLEMRDPGIPRHGQSVWGDDRSVGTVTSGIKSPSLGSFIGLAYVEAPLATRGTALRVDVRGRRLAAQVVDRPFYRRVRQEG
jgi:aminomethyltransferase